MNSIDIIITLLGSIGMTFIITQSFLFRGIRKFVDSLKSMYLTKLFHCTQCCGFWTGLINTIGMIFIPYYYIFIVACASSILCYALYLMLRPLMDKYDV